MREYIFKDFVSQRGENVIRAWLDEQPAAAKQKINARIRVLEAKPRREHRRPLMAPLQNTKGQRCKGLHEVRVKHDGVEYRPIGYYPEDDQAFILLAGATERGGALVPSGVCQTAFNRKDQLERGESTADEHDFR